MWEVLPKFTQWAMLLATLTFALGVKIKSAGSSSVNEENKHNFFCAWKWFYVLVELAVPCEALVTVYFWTTLFAQAAETWDHLDVLQRAGFCMDHSVPMALLLIEFCLMNSVLTMGRHIIAILILVVSYLALNITWCFTMGPVYPDMTWQGTKGILLPFVLLAVGLLFFCLTLLLSRVKNQYMGNLGILNSIKEKKVNNSLK
jgi:hypothetical protein